MNGLEGMDEKILEQMLGMFQDMPSPDDKSIEMVRVSEDEENPLMGM